MRPGRALIAGLASLAVVAGPAAAQKVENGPSYAVYCHPDNVASDPPDVPPGGSVKGPLPGGLVEREIAVGAVKTFVIEGGDRSKPAVVIVPGNPESGRDFVPLLAALATRAHVVSYDIPGFGHADKPRDFEYTVAGQTDFLEGVLDQLGVRTAIIGGHDIGVTYALEWIIRHPDRALGAFISGGGLAVGYTWHNNARIWRTPEQGETFWTVVNRPLWSYGVNQGQPQPLPEEFVNRMYDDLDRMTRCAVLDTYRNATAPDENGRRQSAALAPLDLPALVVWGRHDPYIGPEYAEKQKLGFPRAEVHIFDNAAHWAFVDDPVRTAAVFMDFVDRVLAPRGRLRITPGRWRAGARHLQVRVSSEPAARDVVLELRRGKRRIARSRKVASVASARTLRLRLAKPLRPGLYRLRATAVNAEAVAVRVRVL